MAHGEAYEEFVEKFKPKKTTDDCYTPPIVYEAIANWLAKNYGLNRADFCRPFYPGGDYQAEDYTGKIVVDNPPFSILQQIVSFYTERKIRYFLFAPTLTLFSVFAGNDEVAAIPCDAEITYANGATVNTSFVTSLEPPDIRVHGYPMLYKAVAEADKANRGASAKPELPKYVYPDNVVTAAMAKCWRYTDYSIPKSESRFIRGLDSQKANKKTIFGGGLLLSDTQAAKAQAVKAQAVKAQAVKAREATVWTLSNRERAIIDELGGNK